MPTKPTPLTPILTLSLALLASGLAAQTIVPSRGVDARVDYPALLEFGPWDDRNYALTAEDLALLSPGEEELPILIPLFYRVELRRELPGLPTEGPLRYPRSALQRFKGHYGGYLVDGKVHSKLLRRDDGRIAVDLSEGVEEARFFEERESFLNGDIRLTSPEGAAEAAIEIHPTNPDLVIAGVNAPVFGQEMFYSEDGGESWTKAAFPTGDTCCDPTIDFSSDGSLAYTASLPATSGGNLFYRSSDGGKTWNDLPGGVVEVGDNGADKEYIHSDKSLTSPFVDNLYMTWQRFSILWFAHSTDFGETWQTKSVSSGPDEWGIGSDIVTDKDGNVYYFWPAFISNTILVRKSLNGGESFQPTRTVAMTEADYAFPIPAADTRMAWIYLSAGVDLSDGPYGNSIYAAWTDTYDDDSGVPEENHTRIQVAYSRDGGQSWTVTTPHEIDDQNEVDRFNHWLAVAPDGSVHVVYYDTRRGDRSSVDLFTSMSTDGAQTWSEPRRVTSELSPKIDNFFEWGDYNGAAAVGRDLLAIYTDNRNETGGGADSVDVYVTGLEISESGLTLALPAPGRAGVDNTFELSGAAPDSRAFLVFGSEPGTSDIPCGGTVEIDEARVLQSAQTDAEGRASFVVSVPDTADGTTGRFVAVNEEGCTVSNLVQFTFPEALSGDAR